MSDTERWDMEYRPHRLRIITVVAAVVVLAIHITFGALLTISDTGVRNIGWADQLAIILIGTLEAAAILLFLRPRLRVGREGVAVRNLVSDRIFGWDRVVGLTYPDRGFGARLVFADDEHIPVLAVQAGDGAQAVAAMNRYRELDEHYRTAAAAPADDPGVGRGVGGGD